MMLAHTTKVERRMKIAGKGLSSNWQTVISSVKCLALPATMDDNISPNLTVGKDFSVYFMDGVDIQEGDKLTTSIGVVLYVSGVSRYVGIPRMSHLEVSATTQGVGN